MRWFLKPQSFTVFPVIQVYSDDGFWQQCDWLPWWLEVMIGSRWHLKLLLRWLCDGSLVFEGVNERQYSSLYTGRDPTGHRVSRGRCAACLLGGGAGHQTLLIPQLRERERDSMRELHKLQSYSCWLHGCGGGKLDWHRLLPLIDSNDSRLQSLSISFSVCAYVCFSVINGGQLILWLTHTAEGTWEDAWPAPMGLWVLLWTKK